MKPTLEQIESALRRWAELHPLIREIHIFGSRVKGTAHPESDLDLAIHADQRPGDSGATTVHFEQEDWQAELSHLLDIPVDVEELTDEHVWQYVQEASRLVYQRADAELITARAPTTRPA